MHARQEGAGLALEVAQRMDVLGQVDHGWHLGTKFTPYLMLAGTPRSV
jgi:hypothetical protein